MSDAEVADTLRLAKKEIENSGWCQGTLLSFTEGSHDTDVSAALTFLRQNERAKWDELNAVGPVCMIGAVNRATTGRAVPTDEEVSSYGMAFKEALPAIEALAAALVSSYPAELPAYVTRNLDQPEAAVWGINDANNTTKEMVLDLLDKAVALLEDK